MAARIERRRLAPRHQPNPSQPLTGGARCGVPGAFAMTTANTQAAAWLAAFRALGGDVFRVDPVGALYVHCARSEGPAAIGGAADLLAMLHGDAALRRDVGALPSVPVAVALLTPPGAERAQWNAATDRMERLAAEAEAPGADGGAVERVAEAEADVMHTPAPDVAAVLLKAQWGDGAEPGTTWRGRTALELICADLERLAQREDGAHA